MSFRAPDTMTFFYCLNVDQLFRIYLDMVGHDVEPAILTDVGICSSMLKSDLTFNIFRNRGLGFPTIMVIHNKALAKGVIMES